MKTTVTIKSNQFLNILIYVVWCDRTLLPYFKVAIARLLVVGNYENIITTCVYVLLVILSLKEIRINRRDIIIGIAVVLTYVMSALLNQDTQAIWTESWLTFLFTIFPLFYVGKFLGEVYWRDGQIIEQLYKLSLISIIVSVFVGLAFGGDLAEIDSMYSGDMYSAYNLLPHVCMVGCWCIRKPNRLNIIVSVIGVMYLLFLGSRGPLFLAMLCFAIMLLWIKRWKYKWFMVSFALIGIIVFIYSPLFIAMLKGLYRLAESMGLYVRILDKMLTGQITDLSGRDVFAEVLYQNIRENPFGYGIYADRILTGGSYAHKLHIELWIHYGVIVGTGVLFTFLLVPIRAFCATKDTQLRILLIVLVCTGVIKLFISGTYTEERILYMLLGLSAGIIGLRKRHT